MGEYPFSMLDRFAANQFSAPVKRDYHRPSWQNESLPAVEMLPKLRYKHTTRAVSVLDRMPLIVAAYADDVPVRLRSRRPGQCAARRRALSVAFLSALSAAAVHRLAAGVRCVVRRAGAGDGGHGGRGGGDADPDGVSRRPLRRAAVSGRRDPVDDPVDRGDGARDLLLAGRRAGIVVRGSAIRSFTRRITRSSAARWIGRNWGVPSPFTPLPVMSGLPPPRRPPPR